MHHRDLGVRGGLLRVGGLELGLGARDLDVEIGGIELEQHVAGPDELVVVDADGPSASRRS